MFLLYVVMALTGGCIAVSNNATAMSTFAFFEGMLGQVNLLTGDVVPVTPLSSWQFFDTCFVSGDIIYTAGIVDNRRLMVGISRSLRRPTCGSSSCLTISTTTSHPAIWVDTKVLPPTHYFIDQDAGYLYSNSSGSFANVWSLPGNKYRSCSPDIASQTVWCSGGASGIFVFDYIRKTVRTFASLDITIGAMFFDPISKAAYALVKVPDSVTLVYKIDTDFTWSLLTLVRGFSPVDSEFVTVIDARTQGGDLVVVFVAFTGFSYNIVSVDIVSGEVLSSPVIKWTGKISALCAAS